MKKPTALTCFQAAVRILVLLLAGLLFGPASSSAQQANYVLAPNDLITVTVFQEDDLLTKVRVGNDGTISVPLIGSVRVGGKSVDEAGQIIRARLAKGYLVNPQVNVAVTEFAKRIVTVLGEVQKAGTFEFPNQGPLDLLQAIGLAGGYSNKANPGRIVVKRQVNGKDVVFEVNGKALAAKKNTQPFEILPGDTVTVAESIF